jgi:hypothetical protein
MDTDTLVEKSHDEVRMLVEELPRRGFPVSAALWVKMSENEKWYFYIVSPVVDEAGLREAYGRMQPLVREMQTFWIEPLKIHLIGPSDPIASGVLAYLARLPRLRVSPIPWRGMWLGDKSVLAAYIYPVPVPTP